jgi:D-alanyl-D-alanine carboxypeptidase
MYPLLRPMAAVPILVMLVACAQDRPDPYQQAFQAIDRVVAAAMDEAGTPGLALAITSEEELLYEGYYGFSNLQHHTPVDAETLFQIGSISKSFTALALMRLMDEGHFDPHRPIEDYLPWWEVQTRYEPITGHHLLTHTAGIPASRDDIPGGRFMVWAQRDQATGWPPGERFHYSNLGYQTLGVLLEELSGESYADAIERLILDPLGMDASYPSIELERRTQQATGYIPAYDDRPPHRSYPLVEAPFLEYWMGDGSIQSTAIDMATYMRMLMKKGQGPEKRIVSEKAFDAFATAYTNERLGVDGSWGYGYGIAIASSGGHHFLTHSGDMVGLHANISIDLDDRMGIVVLVNGPTRWRDIFDYAREALRAADGGAAPPPMPEPDDRARVDNAAEYAGEFTSSSGSTLVITSSVDRLLLQHHGEALVLERFGEDSFVASHPDFNRYLFRFGRDDNGTVVEVTHGPRWFTHHSYGGSTAFDNPEVWSAYTGRYRSYSPWFPYFEILTRKGQLVAVLGNGGETSYAELVLESRGDHAFRPGENLTPEVLRFENIVEGEALRATWSGHQFFKVAE